MAIRVSEYFKRYRAQNIALLMVMQVIAVSMASALTWVLWQYFNLDNIVAFAIGMVSLLLLELVLSTTLVAIASGHLGILAQAIAHVSKDSVQTPPPSVKGIWYQRSGLKALVQAVYELAASSAAPTEQLPPDMARSVIDETLLSTMPCGVIALNANGQVLFANPLAPVHENSSGQRMIELLFEQSDHLESWLLDCQANKVRDTKIWHRIANSVPGQEGRRIFDVIGYYTKNGRAGVETILVTIDRTADYAPDDENMDFIALAAHELRGPITIIRGYLDLLDEELATQLQPDQQQLIDRLQVSAERLSGYINNILNVSRYDRNHLKLHLHEEHLIDIIKTLIPDLALRAKTQRRRLSFYIDDNLPTIAADRSSLSEVFSNLIDNAIKYSHEDGEVIVRANAKGDFAEITVQDFGIGMPESVVGNLFNKFYRSHRSRQQVSGTGLGLYICKAIVESHGGSIWVSSIEGQGTTFGFTMPIYASVADKLAKGDNSNEQIIERSDGWIKNHAMYRR